MRRRALAGCLTLSLSAHALAASAQPPPRAAATSRGGLGLAAAEAASSSSALLDMLIQELPSQVPGPNPILRVGGGATAWDGGGVQMGGGVLQTSADGRYYLFYSGTANSTSGTGGTAAWQVGVASAPQPFGPWRKHGDAPVLAFAAAPQPYKVQGSGGAADASKVKGGAPHGVTSGAWDGGALANPHVLRRQDGTLAMFYSGRAAHSESGWAVGVAVSNTSALGPWRRAAEVPLAIDAGGATSSGSTVTSARVRGVLELRESLLLYVAVLRTNASQRVQRGATSGAAAVAGGSVERLELWTARLGTGGTLPSRLSFNATLQLAQGPAADAWQVAAAPAGATVQYSNGLFHMWYTMGAEVGALSASNGAGSVGHAVSTSALGPFHASLHNPAVQAHTGANASTTALLEPSALFLPSSGAALVFYSQGAVQAPSAGPEIAARSLGTMALLRGGRDTAPLTMRWPLMHDVTLGGGQATAWSAALPMPTAHVQAIAFRVSWWGGLHCNATLSLQQSVGEEEEGGSGLFGGGSLAPSGTSAWSDTVLAEFVLTQRGGVSEGTRWHTTTGVVHTIVSPAAGTGGAPPVTGGFVRVQLTADPSSTVTSAMVVGVAAVQP